MITLPTINGWTVHLHNEFCGYFDKNGEAIGGLIFGKLDGPSQQIELTDFDGLFELPVSVVKALRQHGIHVDTTFDQQRSA